MDVPPACPPAAPERRLHLAPLELERARGEALLQQRVVALQQLARRPERLCVLDARVAVDRLAVRDVAEREQARERLPQRRDQLLRDADLLQHGERVLELGGVPAPAHPAARPRGRLARRVAQVRVLVRVALELAGRLLARREAGHDLAAAAGGQSVGREAPGGGRASDVDSGRRLGGAWRGNATPLARGVQRASGSVSPGKRCGSCSSSRRARRRGSPRGGRSGSRRRGWRPSSRRGSA